MLCSSVELFDRCQNPGGMSYNGLYGEAPPERGSFFGSQVYERVGISLFEVYERVGRSVLEVCKKAQKDQQMYFMDVKKSWFIHIYKTLQIQQLKGMQRSNLGMWKVYHLSIEGWTAPGRSLLVQLLCCVPPPGAKDVKYCKRSAVVRWRRIYPPLAVKSFSYPGNKSLKSSICLISACRIKQKILYK